MDPAIIYRELRNAARARNAGATTTDEWYVRVKRALARRWPSEVAQHEARLRARRRTRRESHSGTTTTTRSGAGDE